MAERKVVELQNGVCACEFRDAVASALTFEISAANYESMKIVPESGVNSGVVVIKCGVIGCAVEISLNGIMVNRQGQREGGNIVNCGNCVKRN